MAASRLAVKTSQKWRDRRTLRVYFMDGDPDLHEYIARLVEGPLGWNSVSGLQFRFTDEPNAEIRIKFGAEYGSSWSHVGTDALYVPDYQQTMHLNVRIEDAGAHIDRPILHELGHAMGFIHGQQSPYAGELDEAAVYAWYESRGYTRSWIDANVLSRYGADEVEVIGADVPSIMNYWLPAELWEDGKERETASYPTYWDAYAAETWYGPPPSKYTSVILPWVARS